MYSFALLYNDHIFSKKIARILSKIYKNLNFANFVQKIMIRKWCKGVHYVDLGESFQTHVFLQNLASIQPRTSPVKFARPSNAAAIGPPPRGGRRARGWPRASPAGAAPSPTPLGIFRKPVSGLIENQTEGHKRISGGKH